MKLTDIVADGARTPLPRRAIRARSMTSACDFSEKKAR